MTDVPIIFSAPMVRALLDGRKTMTRRLAWRVKVKPGESTEDATGEYPGSAAPNQGPVWAPSRWQKVKPGDRLYVRESFGVVTDEHRKMSTRWAAGTILHRADHGIDIGGSVPDCMRWQPSIHMPRWASRLILVVTATKIEPVQAISEEDARAEGALPADIVTGREVLFDDQLGSYRLHFRDLWVSLHGPDAWDRNPAVVVLTFAVHPSNVVPT